MEQVEDMRYLLDRVGRAGLLTVAESGIGDEARIRRAGRDDSIVKADAAYLSIRIKFAVELGVGSFFKVKTAFLTLREKFHLTSI